ncbi:MAG: cytidylate kinase-like family protein [Lachnospiraceae bacterium]
MKYNIITIEREYASGGSEIGEMLSKRLHIPCYEKEILERVAEKYSVLPEQLADLEEASTSSLLYSIALSNKIVKGESTGLTDEGALFLAESRVIQEIANENRCIIVGRCANYVLQDRKDVLRVFIHASVETRRKRAMEKYGVAETEVKAVLKKYDKRRSGYYMANANKKWKEIEEYHLMLDSGNLGIERCVNLICTAAE